MSRTLFPHNNLVNEQLENLDEFNYIKGDNNEVCCICLNEYLIEEKVITLPRCEHLFHSQCIKSWLRQSNTCPFCRMVVFEN